MFFALRVLRQLRDFVVRILANLCYNNLMATSDPAAGMDRFVDYWRRREATQRAAAQQLAEQARTDALRIAALLRERFGVRRVILFGSLVDRRFAPGSDIDLAVEGLPRRDFFAALALADEVSRFRVDLKPLEDLEPHFRTRVLATGEDL